MSCPYDYLVVVDFEATADEVLSPFSKDEAEIIEFPWVVLDVKTQQVVESRQIYVKPEKTPVTPFCIELTGITPEKIQNAGSLREAVAAFDQWVEKEMAGKSFCLLADGPWDLDVQLPRECEEKKIPLAGHYDRYYDLKVEYQKWRHHVRTTGEEIAPINAQATNADTSSRSSSLTNMCLALNLDVQGHLHTGLDDCATIAAIAIELMKRNVRGLHPARDRAARVAAHEAQVTVDARHPLATLSEIKQWFTLLDMPAPSAAFCVVADTDRGVRRPVGSVFVRFDAHEEALRALSLNGRIMGPRYIVLRPSSAAEVEAAHTVLMREHSPVAPAPSSPPRNAERQYRLGDWLCTTCATHNFSYRMECFRCSARNPTVAPSVMAAAAGAVLQQAAFGAMMQPQMGLPVYYPPGSYSPTGTPLSSSPSSMGSMHQAALTAAAAAAALPSGTSLSTGGTYETAAYMAAQQAQAQAQAMAYYGMNPQATLQIAALAHHQQQQYMVRFCSVHLVSGSVDTVLSSFVLVFVRCKWLPRARAMCAPATGCAVPTVATATTLRAASSAANAVPIAASHRRLSVDSPCPCGA